MQNESEILQNAIESIKKDHSAASQIPTKQQSLPYPQSTPSPQKIAVENTEKELKKQECGLHRYNLTAKLNKTSNKLYTKHHANFVRTEKQFQELLNTDPTQTEI